jgi:hypothetical protein
MKKKNVFVGIIPDIFGYGLSVVSGSKAGAMKALRAAYESVKNARPDPTTTFETSFEYFGGYVSKVKFNDVSTDAFRN